MTLSYQFRKSFLLVFLLVISSSLLNAQARYKHMPRVKIKKTPVELISNETIQPANTISQALNNETSAVNQEVATPVVSDVESALTPVTFADKTIASTPVKKLPAKTMVKNESHSTFRYVPMQHKKLFKPEETAKTNVSVALILLIVFYVLAAIFTVLCILAIYLWANFSMFIVFLILAIVFGLAGSVLSLLLKFGVVN